ncbi:MAG: hypothetical protein HY287_00495 [Planctomycetes bacterium]|nr:hypothetical protein [Planctomycetota bacterium]MBI3832792.1 hypothetical protein [Planctomycetota bacterium]
MSRWEYWETAGLLSSLRDFEIVGIAANPALAWPGYYLPCLTALLRIGTIVWPSGADLYLGVCY